MSAGEKTYARTVCTECVAADPHWGIYQDRKFVDAVLFLLWSTRMVLHNANVIAGLVKTKKKEVEEKEKLRPMQSFQVVDRTCYSV